MEAVRGKAGKAGRAAEEQEREQWDTRGPEGARLQSDPSSQRPELSPYAEYIFQVKAKEIQLSTHPV